MDGRHVESMVSRRRALQLATTALVGAAGCLDWNEPAERSPTGGTERPETERRSTDGDGPAEWTPSWTRSTSEEHVLGLDAADELLYATLGDEGGPSAVAAVDPAERTVVWRAEFEGEAVAGSYDRYRPLARDQWGVTLTDESVYTVNGRDDSFDWTTVHALDRATGEERWSLRREQELAIHGAVDGMVFATGLEFFEPQHSHDAPEDPLASTLYAVDVRTGSVRWTAEFAGVADVAVGADAAYVATGTELAALSLDGERRWRVEGRNGRRVCAAGDRVYYVAERGDGSTVHGLDRGGAEAWSRTFPVHEFLLDGERLYCGGDAVVALDPDGSVAWRDDAYGKWLLFDPGRETLYTRGGRAADAVGAYATDGGEKRWAFDAPSTNAWPAAATDDAAVAQAITADNGPFYTLYAVGRDDGRATAAFPKDKIFAVESLDGTVFVGDDESTITALEP